LNLIATAAFGAAVGGVAGLCARREKIRNGTMVALTAMLSAMSDLWMAWVFDATARFWIAGSVLLLHLALLPSTFRQMTTKFASPAACARVGLG